MRSHTLERRQRLRGSPEDVFALFADAFNLERITPPWLRFRVLTPAPVEMGEGTLLTYRLRLHGIPIRWLTRIACWDPPRRFVDVQLEGPYRLWHHTHEFEPAGDDVLLRDVVRYALPAGPLGELAHRAFVRRDLERIFDVRRDAVRALYSPASRPASRSR